MLVLILLGTSVSFPLPSAVFFLISPPPSSLFSRPQNFNISSPSRPFTLFLELSILSQSTLFTHSFTSRSCSRSDDDRGGSTVAAGQGCKGPFATENGDVIIACMRWLERSHPSNPTSSVPFTPPLSPLHPGCFGAVHHVAHCLSGRAVPTPSLPPHLPIIHSPPPLSTTQHTACPALSLIGSCLSIWLISYPSPCNPSSLCPLPCLLIGTQHPAS